MKIIFHRYLGLQPERISLIFAINVDAKFSPFFVCVRGGGDTPLKKRKLCFVYTINFICNKWLVLLLWPYIIIVTCIIRWLNGCYKHSWLLLPYILILIDSVDGAAFVVRDNALAGRWHFWESRAVKTDAFISCRLVGSIDANEQLPECSLVFHQFRASRPCVWCGPRARGAPGGME